jgi:dihydrodipicolinate synthase/N-acetylneuraminate lyase
VAGLKLAMDVAGLKGGHVRAPLRPAPASLREELAGLLRQAHAAV